MLQKQEQVQKILTSFHQNFGKINVAPDFTEEDLVPVEVSDISDLSGPEDDEDGGRKTKRRGRRRTVIRDLDEKIAKYKQFLDRAKSKRFSAIRIPKALSETMHAPTEEKRTPAEPRPKVNAEAGRKRKAEGDGEQEPQSKMTSKQRRRLDRAQRSKKVGARYYETHNVKNKNKDRKKPRSTEGKKNRISKH
ncbi:hypothetical protein AAFF_G00329810 [Aldrovandia affinis]|uniref:Uncharacterized protein n=1 Tax=Aldrovandia affinis TaxID=143900 RepID=A0AAD7WQA1_9TELE|nr:hypothetical protein AAFF_G00329810 [Aldrovandia affinis]